MAGDVYNYNDKTQLSTATLRGGIAEQFSYDAAGDQTGSTYTDTHTNTSIADSSGTLDDQGRPHVLTEVSKDAAGNVTASSADILGYTSIGQLSDAYQSAAGGTTVHYDYFGPTDTGVGQEPGAIKDMVLIGINGQPLAGAETDYTYDSAGRLWQISVGGVTYTYYYKPGTNLVSSIAGEVDPIFYGYDPATGQLSSITAMATSTTDPGVQTAYSASYLYNNNQQRSADLVTQTNADGTSTTSDDGYAYDGQDRLHSVTDLNTNGQLYGYAYDGVGNRTDLGSVNAMNEHGSLVYDSRGDVINDGTFEYAWDAKGRLASVTPNNPASGSQKDVFSYDEQDRRTEKDVYIRGDGNWILTSELKFVYDGSQIVAELDGTNRLLQAYTWGSNGTLLSITDFTTGYPHVYQVVTDATGNVVQLDDASSGAVVASYRYDPWGNPITPNTPAAEGQTNLCPFRWQGEFYDAAFGGYDMGAREGSATLHMFLSPDPSGESSDVNLYRMDGNDPINNVDPTGTTGVNLDRYRSETQVWNEAKLEVQQKYGVDPAAPWDQKVPGTGIIRNQSYGDLVAASYNAKVSWYAWGQGSTLKGAPSVEVVSDAEFARQQAIAAQPPSISPERLTPDQVRRQQNAQYWQAEVNAGRAVPEAAEAAQILARNDGSLIWSAWDAVQSRKEILATGLAGVGALIGRTDPTPFFNSNFVPREAVTIDGRPQRVLPGEITTFQDFVDRSVVGDNLEGHELWQHANLRALGLATKRLSTPASKNNPVIALDRAIHQRINIAQGDIDAAAQLPPQNIDANALLLRSFNVVPETAVDQLRQMSIQHAKTYGY